MTPAETMRAAAAKLREMADDLGEWWYDENITHVRDRNGDLVTGAGREEGRWVALMGPQRAESLAGWLEATAEWTYIESLIAGGSARATLAKWQEAALAFACAVLGSQS